MAGFCLQAAGTLTATTAAAPCGSGGSGGIGTITVSPPLGISLTGASIANISLISADIGPQLSLTAAGVLLGTVGGTLAGGIFGTAIGANGTLVGHFAYSNIHTNVGGVIGSVVNSGTIAVPAFVATANVTIDGSTSGTISGPGPHTFSSAGGGGGGGGTITGANNNLTVSSNTVGAGSNVVINTVANTFTAGQSFTGGVLIGAATGGLPAAGAINAQSVLINNVAAMTNFRTNANGVIGTVTNGGTIAQFVAVAGSGITIDGTAGSGTYGPGIHTFSAATGGGGGIGSIVSGNTTSATISNLNTITVPRGTNGAVFGFLSDALTFSGNNSFGGTILHSGIETFSGTIVLGGKIDVSYQAFNTATLTVGSSFCGHMLDYTNSVTGTLVWPTGLTDCNVGEAYFGTGSLVNTFLAGTTVVGAAGTIGPSTIYAGISVHEFDNANNQYVFFGSAK